MNSNKETRTNSIQNAMQIQRTKKMLMESKNLLISKNALHFL